MCSAGRSLLVTSPLRGHSVGQALGGDRVNPSTAEGQEQAGMEPLIQQIHVGILPWHFQRALPAPAPNPPFPAMGNAESEQRLT